MPLSFLKSSTALPFAYDLVRSSRRRSIRIEIAKAHVVVRAPYFVAKSDIEKFVRQKSLWIQQKLEQQAQQISNLPEYSFEPGSQLPFLGELLELVVQTQRKASVMRLGSKLLISLSSHSTLPMVHQIQRLVYGWYQEQALELLQIKTNEAVERLKVRSRFAGLKIRATRSKWGHCTAQGVIQYNWQILLAPEPIVDYLVAHEVSHLLHHNHSPSFWAVVASLCPDYKNRRAWLKNYGMQLMF